MASVANQFSATQAAREIAAGRLTSETLVRACLARIAERESTVQAWAFLDPELAIEQARACDRGPRRGVLHGVPVYKGSADQTIWMWEQVLSTGFLF
jgi:Asp-tRNA(Asn)/Glu-tRNA(Gln) amidotransferase A subunit family amidase